MANITNTIQFTNESYSALTNSLIDTYNATSEPLISGFVVLFIGFLLYVSGAFFGNNVLQLFAGIWFLIASFSFIDAPLLLGTIDFIFFALLGLFMIFSGISGILKENKERKTKYKVVDDYD